MSEIAAAMGLCSLEGMDDFIAVNKRNYHAYLKNLAGQPGVRVLTYDEKERNNYQYVVLEVDEQLTGVSRDHLMKILHAEGIRARRYFYPGCHRMEPYRSYFPHAGLLLPVTERLGNRVLCLPTGRDVDQGDVETICEITKFVMQHGKEVEQRLHAGREEQ
jgi:dTDP-4-amino-4,6-dideoxygalactose transaminase